jgi:hypothetical protein
LLDPLLDALLNPLFDADGNQVFSGLSFTQVGSLPSNIFSISAIPSVVNR